MSKVKAKIYYLIATGEVLIITSECQGCVVETTKENDMGIYLQLKDKNIDEIDFIELPYGTLIGTFTNVKSCSVNVETKTLERVYCTQEDIDAQKSEQQAQEALNSSVSTISDYMNIDTTSIADIENYILQRETNKITGGM